LTGQHIERLVTSLREGPSAWNEWRRNVSAEVIDLRGADLSGLPLAGANLSRCNLHGALLNSTPLQGADLQYSDLVRAKLFQANLQRANLHGANLRSTLLAKANLEDADLSNATLHGANLQGASLRRTNLEFTVFARCDLRGTDFRKAVCGGTVFSQIKLSEARHLEATVHLRASSVGIETLTLSRDKLPLAFLRGCGVEDDVLTFLSTPRLGNDERFYSVFISYSHEDRIFAVRLHDSLQTAGIRCWLDERRMRPGDDIYEEVEKGIREQERILLCASKHSLSSWWVDSEIDAAFAKERDLMKITKQRSIVLIPINLDGYMFSESWKSGKRRLVQSRLAADFTDPKRFDDEFHKLVEALRRRDDGLQVADVPRR
jgi:uncharacterized protein YjbI with pentapeptide repeats